jgi:di/tricarboxylate transporter
VPGDNAFVGLSHPAVITVAVITVAVITVAAVLVLSRGLALSGATDLLAKWLLPKPGTRFEVSSVLGVGALLSSVMNNVGALALMLPIAGRDGPRSSRVLMPLAFATILGGLITAIGTPPNLVVAAMRAEAGGEPFGIFDFAPVGLVVTAVGLIFIAVFRRRLVPTNAGSGKEHVDTFEMEDYLAEARVGEKSAALGLTIAQLDPLIAELDVKVVGLIRSGRLVAAVPRLVRLQLDDVLMVEAPPQDLQPFLTKLGLTAIDPGAPKVSMLQSDEVGLLEAIVTPGSHLEGRSVLRARLQRQYGINLLAVSRQGTPYRGRLRSFRFAAGDVLLLQGEAERLRDVAGAIGCLPLAERGLRAKAPVVRLLCS